MSDLNKLCKIINYKFSDLDLLRLAVTHKSFGHKNNERIEFLGDSVLNYSISSEIFNNFSELSEGKLTRVRAKLVSKEYLYKIAKEMELGDYIILGSSEKCTGGHQRRSILADGLEAIFGAVYLDSNIDKAKSVIINLYKDKIALIVREGSDKDPKTELQEVLQAREHLLPKYKIIKKEGKPHEQKFHVSCDIPLLKDAIIAIASTRRKAEQKAAKQALELIKLAAKDKTKTKK